MNNRYQGPANELLNHSVDGISGVFMMNSGKEGPTVAISACTHGGEHAGLEAIDELKTSLSLQKYLARGKIYFILSNPEAYLHSIRSTEDYEVNLSNEEFNEKRFSEARFIDGNMNRVTLPELIRSDKELALSEQIRARELLPILNQVDVHLDIHTYSKPGNDSMLICSHDNYEKFAKDNGFDGIVVPSRRR